MRARSHREDEVPFLISSFKKSAVLKIKVVVLSMVDLN